VTRFNRIEVEIRRMEGCEYLRLFRDTKDPRIFFTHSIWLNEEYLNKYRQSEFSGINWPEVKELFAKSPIAWSLDQRDELA